MDALKRDSEFIDKESKNFKSLKEGSTVEIDNRFRVRNERRINEWQKIQG